MPLWKTNRKIKVTAAVNNLYPSRRQVLRAALVAAAATNPKAQKSYADGRPSTTLRLDALDQGPIIRHGTGPNQCDYLGAREAICFRSGSTYYLHYDGAGPTGWHACLAVSHDLHRWSLKGPVLDLGKPGSDDSGTASSPWTIFDGTLAATSLRPDGPWHKQTNLVPFHTKPGTYYADTASPGQIVKQNDEYLMFFSAAAFTDESKKHLLRTLSIARTKNLDSEWTVDAQPALPPEQQIENSALYFEPSNQTWFLFTNHIGLDDGGEYTESIWVYWSRDLNHWESQQRAIVLDRTNCQWSKRCIGMPSVVQVGEKLALFYDASTTKSGNMGRDVGLAWLNLPLRVPR
jgi:predicted GH43/DUF377 family glycosyl hydrolase